MEPSALRNPHRRQFLRTAAGTGAGMASWLVLGTPPAFAQKRELTFLSTNHFVPASDDELRELAEQFMRAEGRVLACLAEAATGNRRAMATRALEELAASMVELGYTYLKLDFTYAPSIPGAYADDLAIGVRAVLS